MKQKLGVYALITENAATFNSMEKEKDYIYST